MREGKEVGVDRERERRGREERSGAVRIRYLSSGMIADDSSCDRRECRCMGTENRREGKRSNRKKVEGNKNERINGIKIKKMFNSVFQIFQKLSSLVWVTCSEYIQ